MISKCTLAHEIDGIQCIYGIPLARITSENSQNPDVQLLKAKLNKIKKVKIKERRSRFIEYLEQSKRDFMQTIADLYDLGVMGNLYEEDPPEQPALGGYNDSLLTELLDRQAVLSNS